jgi:2-oxoglutarate dehydrogenase E2 component (dihydrolipoamide succinyltransferase)
MAVEVQVPALGESVHEATVGRWLKKEGDAVAVGDPLVELETEKVAVEVAAEAPGVIQRIDRREGETVHVGDVLAVLANGDRAAAARPAAAVTQPPSEAPAKAAAATSAPGALTDGGAVPGSAPPKIAPTERSSAPASGSGERAPSAPSARRLAAEEGIDLSQVSGTGPGGRITRQDVAEQAPALRGQSEPGPPRISAPATAQPTAPSPQPGDGTAPSLAARPEERVPLSRRRLTIARRLVEAQQTAAILTTFNEADMSAVMTVRQRRRDEFKEKYGVSLGFMSFFTKAAVGALKAFPQVNAELRDGELILKRYYDIGIAVGAEEGLVVPVVRDADRKSFAQIEQEIADLARRARENALKLEELMGGTFTLTNGGVFGSLLSTPILNPPQVGILGLHKIQERPVAMNGQVEVRPMMYLALSYDHRVVDGREAVQFLVRIKELIEDPEKLLLEG